MMHLPWQMLVLGVLAAGAATMVAGRRGFLLTTPAVLLAGWAWLHPNRALAWLDAGIAQAVSLLQSNPLAEIAGTLPILDPIWFVFLGVVALVVVGKFAFATRID
jgi:hypothetical protein